MKIELHQVRMTDVDTWRCAREEIAEHHAVLVGLSCDGEQGWGEASAFMTSVYNSTTEEVARRIRVVAPIIERFDPANSTPADLHDQLAPILRDCPFALAAVDVAVHDLAARLAGVPLHRYLGLASPRGRASSYSIGLDTLDTMVEKLRAAPGWAMYKVKLAEADDLDVLRALRAHTDAPFWVDGNACWSPSALFDVVDEMAELGVVTLEQPFAVTEIGAQREARRRSPFPIVADESVTTPDQLGPAAEIFDGVNVKVLKSGGLAPAVTMLRRAAKLGLTTMLGCLPESSAGASAAAHVADLADHVDVDTIALLAVDTGAGVSLDGTGRLELPAAGGTGFVPDFTAPVWGRRLL